MTRTPFSAYGFRIGATGCKPLNPLGGRTTPSELRREHPLGSVSVAGFAHRYRAERVVVSGETAAESGWNRVCLQTLVPWTGIGCFLFISKGVKRNERGHQTAGRICPTI